MYLKLYQCEYRSEFCMSKIGLKHQKSKTGGSDNPLLSIICIYIDLPVVVMEYRKILIKFLKLILYFVVAI